MIIDAHAHLGNNNDKIYTPEELLASMDKAEIKYSILIATSSSDPQGLKTDEVIEVGKKFDRLKPIGAVDWNTLDEKQIQKLQSHLKKDEIYGLKFYPGYEDFYPIDEKLFPLYEFCQEIGKPIIYHTGLLEINYPGKLKQSHPLNIDEVANRFPNLKIIMAHIGYPWVTDTACVVWKNPNVYTDVSSLTEEYVSTMSEEDKEIAIKKLLELKSVLGDFKKCLFGTDYPLYSQSEHVKLINELPMTQEEKDRVFWQNAMEIFNLKR